MTPELAVYLDKQSRDPAPAKEAHRHRLRRFVIWGLLLAPALAFALVLHAHEDAKKAAAAAHAPVPGINITTATAQKGNIGVYLDSIGTVTPVYTASISSQVTGQIVAGHYTEGQL